MAILMVVASCSSPPRASRDEPPPRVLSDIPDAASLRPTPDAALAPDAGAQAHIWNELRGDALRAFAANAARQARELPGVVVLDGPARPRRLALTFDDGPDSLYTPFVLGVLRRAGVKATFFVTGERAVRHERLLRRLLAAGHEVGPHGYEHIDLRELATEEAVAAVERAAEVIRRAGGAPRYQRPPFGALSDEQARALAARGLVTVLWSVDSSDWWPRTSRRRTARTVASLAHPGAIVLLHADRADTVAVLPRLIRELRAAGYELCTVGELLGEPAPTPPPLPARRRTR